MAHYLFCVSSRRCLGCQSSVAFFCHVVIFNETRLSRGSWQRTTPCAACAWTWQDPTSDRKSQEAIRRETRYKMTSSYTWFSISEWCILNDFDTPLAWYFRFFWCSQQLLMEMTTHRFLCKVLGKFWLAQGKWCTLRPFHHHWRAANSAWVGWQRLSLWAVVPHSPREVDEVECHCTFADDVFSHVLHMRRSEELSKLMNDMFFHPVSTTASLEVWSSAMWSPGMACFSPEVNMSCTILHFVSDPNWRPTFRYHHWSISLIAAALCAKCSEHPHETQRHKTTKTRWNFLCHFFSFFTFVDLLFNFLEVWMMFAMAAVIAMAVSHLNPTAIATDWPTTSGSVVTRPSPSAVSSWLMPLTTRLIRNGVTASKAWNFSCLDEQLLKGKQCWLSATKSRKPVSCMFFWTWSLLKSNVTAASYSPLLLNDLWGEEWRTPIMNSDTHTHISYSRQFLLPEACQEHPD